MKRREFIAALVGAAATWPLVVRAQQPAMPVIGLLSSTSSDTNADLLREFRQGLRSTGYAEAENVAFEYRWADNRIDRLTELAADLVGRRVAVIATGAPPSAFAAKAATTTIPIVFVVAEDPVKLGLVASIARPGGNLTGINFFAVELAAKRLELLRELVPAAARVAVLVDPADAAITEGTVVAVETAARAMGLKIEVLNASTSREIDFGLRDFWARATRRSLRQQRPLLHHPASTIGPMGDTPRGPRDICGPPICRSRRVDKLRSKPAGCLSTGWRLHRSYSQGRAARGLACLAIDQARPGH